MSKAAMRSTTRSAFVDAVAPVRVIGTGWVASAGALIFLAGAKEWRLCLLNTRFLLHQPMGRAARPDNIAISPCPAAS